MKDQNQNQSTNNHPPTGSAPDISSQPSGSPSPTIPPLTAPGAATAQSQLSTSQPTPVAPPPASQSSISQPGPAAPPPIPPLPSGTMPASVSFSSTDSPTPADNQSLNAPISPPVQPTASSTATKPPSLPPLPVPGSSQSLPPSPLSPATSPSSNQNQIDAAATAKPGIPFPPSQPASGIPASKIPASLAPQLKPKPKKKVDFMKLAIPLGVVLILAAIGIFVFQLTQGGGPIGPSTDNKPVTVTYWGLWNSEEVIQPFIDEFTAANPHITINYVNSSPEEYRQRLSATLNSGNKAPDIFRIHNTWPPMFRAHLAAVPEDVYTKEEFQQTFYPVAYSDLNVGGQLRGIPLTFDGLGLYYNQDIFVTAGKQPPTDWDQFQRVASRIKDTGLTVVSGGRVQVAGAAMGITSNIDHWQDILSVIMLQNRANLKRPNNKRAQDALTYYSMFNFRIKSWEGSLPNSTTAFAQGKVAMYFGPSWRAHEINQLAQQQEVDLHYKVVPIPQLLQTNVTWATYWVEAVSANSPVKNEAWQFLKYLSRVDTMQRLYEQQMAVTGRDFGEIPSRVDLGEQFKNHPIIGAYILQAPAAQSWYLVDATTDQQGLNARVSKYYQDAVNRASRGEAPVEALRPVVEGLPPVLAEYGL